LAAVLLSTNKAFTAWIEVFPHAACSGTLVDRVIHGTEVIDIEAESYRATASRKSRNSTRARTEQRRKKHYCNDRLHR
jgi:DNA replication protein DnaC